MNSEVFFWSQNPDFFLVFSHILAVEGLSSVLLDEQEVGKLAGRTSVLAIVLDTENNAEHALRICSLIKADRATAHIPLLALVPGGDERYYLDLLKAGVTESFVRPISPARILTYLQSLMMGPPSATGGLRRDSRAFAVWELSIEASKRLVRHGSEEIQLGPIEFKLLCRLLQAPGRVFSRPELIEAAWPPNYYVQPRTVDVHIGSLRRMLEQMTGRNIIRTIRSSGYAAEFG
ncbi:MULTISPECIES: winged helix-turn-helix domain-containing protein [unclassified Rhizobium]|uniref:winged helix-turn-helix transcriptional regulator n=1 Tax=unclassified Rhizobium TaxID=2613769 RepID=UPI003811D296